MKKMPPIIVCLLLMLFYNASRPMCAEKTFILITEPWPPFIGSELKDNGWTMAVAKAAMEPQGYTVILRLVPWKRALLESRRGDADALYLSFNVKERKQWYLFSKPVGQIRTGLFALKSRHFTYKTLHDLSGYTIGMTGGTSVSPEFDSAPYLRKEETVNDLQSLKKLLLARIDLYAGPELIAKHLIRIHFTPEEQDEIEFLKPPLAVRNLYLAISKNAPDYKQKLADFNNGLETIRANGTYDAILRSHGF